MDRIEDLANAANTCKRFLKCAMSLKFRFRSVAIEETHSRYSNKNAVSAKIAPAFFKNLGHMVESVEWWVAISPKLQDHLFKLLAKFCGKTLRKLSIRNYDPHFNEPNQFPALEHLVLHNAEPKNFCLDSPLKHLEIRNSKEIDEEDLEDLEPWFVLEFPHLESVYFNSQEITGYTLTEFLSLNQQLLSLEIHSEDLPPMIFESIGFYSRNLERLQIKSSEFHEYESSDFHEELLDLSELQKLSQFDVSGRLSLEFLFKMFAENNIPIRSLEVDIEATDKVTTIPTIKTLNKLQCICRSDVDENCLIELVKSQPALQILEVVNMGSIITIEAIEKILEFGKNLTDFEATFCGSDIDMESYNRILSLARDRVKVRIVVWKRKEVNVPADILKMNRNWLTILNDY